ncbi:ribonuclease [Methanobrevibacter olleyae]|uniref:Ribonuclease n=1 Tax=Methanobrevibacter olleyae TaxID=294671 RepID=A0A1I4J3U4_METOL|nr:ribonuclease domain-containing protein [Methanobrevibacter olleyae]SFL61282.1 ribonuclease [Methanobrevibacter olleyae]
MKNWKIIGLILIILLSVVAVSGCIGDEPSFDNSTLDVNALNITEDGTYDSKEEVATYIKEYHKLPSNYITKSEARSLGWHGGSVEKYAPGKCIGGDSFSNRQSILPVNHAYKECDIDTLGADSRGPKRIVYSTDDYEVYYTGDHYASFEHLT